MPIQLPAFPLNGTARLCQLLLPLALCAVPVSNQAAALNDTGITFCAGAVSDSSTTTAATNAVTAAAATRTTAFAAMTTAASKLNTDAAAAATAAASVKAAAAAALTSATTAKTTAETATTGGVAMTATATTAAQNVYNDADSANNVANANATAIATFTSTFADVTGITYTAGTVATSANAAAPTAAQVAKDAATVNATQATKANTDAAKSNATINTAIIALAEVLPPSCTTSLDACTAPVANARNAIQTAFTAAAQAANASSATVLTSDSAAFGAANATATAAANAALAVTYVNASYPTVIAFFNTSLTDAKTAKDSAAKAALSAKAATAAYIASTDATTAATSANAALTAANNVTIDITNYNDARATYLAADTAYNTALAAANAPVSTVAAAAAKAAADAAACVTIAADAGTYPRQDARYGRDSDNTANTLAKTGGGRAGFDFTKIANNGTSLPAATAFNNPNNAVTDWACTKDNVTGLVWEVKTQTLTRSKDLTYTWYNSNTATNGGSAGTANGGECLVAGHCDTEKYVADVNVAALCGFSDWRLPTIKELESIADFSGANAEAAVDATYFPNTPSGNTWASSPLANYSSFAWSVYFKEGNANFGAKSNKYAVRLVRGGQ